MSSSRSACQARATPHCPTPCLPSIQPRRTLPFGIDKPNRARRTPQIPGSQPERASGVLNSIGNLEALSEPQAAWASGEARVRISNLRLPNGHEMVGNRQSTGCRRCAVHDPCHHRASTSRFAVDGAVAHMAHREETGGRLGGHGWMDRDGLRRLYGLVQEAKVGLGIS